jgi:hypothetical protein
MFSMQLIWRALLAFYALHFAASGEAQIYTCTAPDGTKIFSDEKCGPDAKIVPNIATSKQPTRPATVRPKVEPKSPVELEALLKQCNAGDMNACDTWTRGGGPNHLREKERAAERACAAGSLADCEYRYCSGSVNEECRTRVLNAAKVAGNDWYLRETGRTQSDGATRYEIRCVPPGARTLRDVVVTCTGAAGPARCSSQGASNSFARLDLAAAALCAAGE